MFAALWTSTVPWRWWLCIVWWVLYHLHSELQNHNNLYSTQNWSTADGNVKWRTSLACRNCFSCNIFNVVTHAKPPAEVLIIPLWLKCLHSYSHSHGHNTNVFCYVLDLLQNLELLQDTLLRCSKTRACRSWARVWKRGQPSINGLKWRAKISSQALPQ